MEKQVNCATKCIILVGMALAAANQLWAAEPPGVVISHSPASSGRYIGSPSIVILPNGDYVASHDYFGPKSNSNVAATSEVFSSSDRGATWRKIAEIKPLFWGKLFVHRDALYILGTRREYGDVLIRRSTDGGKTWTEPADANTGLLHKGTFHCAPCPVLIHDGRLWRSMEFFTGVWGNFESLVISAPLDADLLRADSWTFSNHLPNQPKLFWLEGNLVAEPSGAVVNVLRTHGPKGDDHAAIVHVSKDGRKLSFDKDKDYIAMTGGGSKFTILFDKASSRYWSIVSQQTNPRAFRNRLVLTSSPDLRTWKVESPLLFHPDAKNHAWQYIDWQFDGDDIVFASRTAFDDGAGGAHNAHDADYLTFHRIENFRTRTPGLLTLKTPTEEKGCQ
jgi:hypothetical protein